MEEDPQPAKLKEAVIIILEAFRGINLRRTDDTPLTKCSLRLHHRIKGTLQALVVAAFLVLGFFERPLWCANSDTVDCNNPYYPNSQLPFINRTTGLCIEGVMLSFLYLDLFLRLVGYGKQYLFYEDKYASSKALVFQGKVIDWISVGQVLLINAYLIDLVCAIATDQYKFRIAKFLRLGLVLLVKPEFKKELHLIITILPRFFKTMSMVAMLILIYALYGIALFDNSTVEGQHYFPDLGEAMWSLLVLLSTANNPDVMMPAYSQHRIVVLFFYSFLTLGLFYLLNLTLAQVFNSYMEEKKTTEEQEREFLVAHLSRAFELLTSNQHANLESGKMPKRTIQAIHDEFASSHIEFSPQRWGLIQCILDQKLEETIEKEDFFYVMDLLHMRFERVDCPTFMDVHFPETAESNWFKKLSNFVRGWVFDNITIIVLVLNLVLLLYEQRAVVTGALDYNDSFLSNPLMLIKGSEIFLLCIFMIEAILRIWVMGFINYACKFHSLFSGIITIVGIMAISFAFSSPTNLTQAKIRTIVIFQILCLLRLVVALKWFQEVGRVLKFAFPAGKRLFVSLFCTMYLFAVLGMMLFGGKITTDPSSAYFAELQGTDYANGNYYANNFNDLGSGMVTLFELLIVNNWYVIVSGFIAVTNKWYRLFFIAFWCVGHLVVLNIVVAFVLDSYNNSQTIAIKDSALSEEHILISPREKSIGFQGLGGSLEPAGSYEGVLSEEFGSVRASQKSPPVFRMKIMAQVNQVLEQRLDHTQDG